MINNVVKRKKQAPIIKRGRYGNATFIKILQFLWGYEKYCIHDIMLLFKALLMLPIFSSTLYRKKSVSH